MINDEVQNQQGGDNSTNLQGRTIVIYNQGISYADAREIALDVYKANFIQLAQDAAVLARTRAEELTDSFLAKLNIENHDAISEMQQPGMQASLFEAQRQYAKTGDKDLEGLLVDILVERASTPERNINQIVLDESLSVASKLTTEQMDALTVNFIISKTINNGINSLERLNEYFEIYIIPFLSSLTITSSCYEHLEYAGCGSVMEASSIYNIELLFKLRYPGLFSNGFEKERFASEIGEISEYARLITQCLHDPEKFQISALNETVLNTILVEENIDEALHEKFISLFHSTEMNEQEIKEYIIKTKPEMQPLFDLWKNSSISKFSLTTVGIAIAHANFRRRTGRKLDLSIWIK